MKSDNPVDISYHYDENNDTNADAFAIIAVIMIIAITFVVAIS
jgi:hypothetical protein